MTSEIRDRFLVTIFSRQYEVDADSYSKAKSIAAKSYNEDMKREGKEEYPISFLVNAARITKLDKEQVGRPREFGDFYDKLGGEGQ